MVVVWQGKQKKAKQLLTNYLAFSCAPDRAQTISLYLIVFQTFTNYL